jgi:hypothetical protein
MQKVLKGINGQLNRGNDLDNNYLNKKKCDQKSKSAFFKMLKKVKTFTFLL